MATSARKRGATFLLEKPLASRLPFEVEQPLSRTFPPPKRIKPAGTSPPWRDFNLDKHPYSSDIQSVTSEMQEIEGREEGDVETSAQRGCWLAGGRGKQSGGGDREGGGEGASSCVGVQEPASIAAAVGRSEPGRGLVQLKIDAMFAAPRLPPKGCSARPGQQSELDLDAGPSEDADCCAGAARKAEPGMDVDSGVVVGAGEGEGEGGPSCYACRGRLGTEGGDVLCSFCDRAACQRCWQKCYACEVPHCSLCLAADYSSQFECYFCPPCYQDRRLESC